MSLPDFSGNESHAWSLNPSDNSFQKFQTILSWLRKLTCYIQTTLIINWFERLGDQETQNEKKECL